MERVRAAMRQEKELVSEADTARQIGSRLARDEPGRARRRGMTVLRPELELGEHSEPSVPPEFDTERMETAA